MTGVEWVGVSERQRHHTVRGQSVLGLTSSSQIESVVRDSAGSARR